MGDQTWVESRMRTQALPNFVLQRICLHALAFLSLANLIEKNCFAARFFTGQKFQKHQQGAAPCNNTFLTSGRKEVSVATSPKPHQLVFFHNSVLFLQWWVLFYHHVVDHERLCNQCYRESISTPRHSISFFCMFWCIVFVVHLLKSAKLFLFVWQGC